MLKNIRSSYFVINIFLYLEERLKLKIIKINKNIQDKLNISILNYKLLSKKYIKFNSNNIIKEYNINNDKLIFEGEYLNGKRNGKGKEYMDTKLIFEGEYLNGKRNGKGKEYDKDGKLKFEGEYLKGRKWLGLLYDKKDKNIKYELINGKGLAKEYNIKSNLIFEGEYLEGKRFRGKEYYDNGKIKFVGNYYQGRRWNGTAYDLNEQILSKFENGKGYLIDEYIFFPALKFEGEYINGALNGKGKVYTNKILFEGEFKNRNRNGKGKEYNFNGELKFEGEYLYDYKRRGKAYINKKLEFEGEYLFDKKWNGKGYDENGNIIYELKNGNGKVKEYHDFIDKLIFEGEYINGKRNGNGKEYDNNGNIIFEGKYLNGKKLDDIENKLDLNPNPNKVLNSKEVDDNSILKVKGNRIFIYIFAILFLIFFLKNII